MNDSNELLSTSKYSFFIINDLMKLKIRPSSLMLDAVHDVCAMCHCGIMVNGVLSGLSSLKHWMWIDLI